MAKLITAQESLKKVDAQSKEKLQNNYRQEQQKRRSQKLKKRVGRIRKLIGEGGDIEQATALLETPAIMTPIANALMPHPNHPRTTTIDGVVRISKVPLTS
jgi:hypothetical protein